MTYSPTWWIHPDMFRQFTPIEVVSVPERIYEHDLSDTMFEDYRAIFLRCMSCDGIINSNEFAVCDECMVTNGPAYRWCCKDEDGTMDGSMPFQTTAYCHWNAAYWGRYWDVHFRRALPA